MRVFRGTQQIISRGISTGENTVDLTEHIRNGNNAFKVEIDDSEQTRSLTFNVVGISIVLTTTFNDVINHGSDVSIPFRIEAEGSRKLHFYNQWK